MKERPIIFSGEMVRAILDGRKKQTRRIMKGKYQPLCGWSAVKEHPGGGFMATTGNPEYLAPTCKEGFYSPYGKPGDRLWVRENFRIKDRLRAADHCRDSVEYAADWTSPGQPWRPSIHMPRWASRITLEITNISAERLQDIVKSNDHIKEGFRHCFVGGVGEGFFNTWESIYGEHSWDKNPWVWVIEFKII